MTTAQITKIENQLINIPKVEIVFFFLLFANRMKRISDILSIPADLRGLINIFDYEDGWSFYFITLGLFSSCLIIKRRFSWTAWNLKLVALFCLFLNFDFSSYIGIFCFLMLLFYLLKPVRLIFFRSFPSDAYKFIFIPISIFLFWASNEFTLLHY